MGDFFVSYKDPLCFKYGYDGALARGIVIKLANEMINNNMQPKIEEVVIFRINDYLIKWIKRYADFFRKYSFTDVFMATYNIIPTKDNSMARDYIIKKVSEVEKILLSDIGKNGQSYSLIEFLIYTDYTFNDSTHYKILPFSPSTMKRILINEGVEKAGELDYALMTVVLGSIIDIFMYILFECMDDLGSDGVSIGSITKTIEIVEKKFLQE